MFMWFYGFKALCIVINFPYPLLYLSSFLSCPFLKRSIVIYQRNCPGIYSFYKISAAESNFKMFSHLSYSFLFLSFLFDCVRFQYSQEFMTLLFLQEFWFFPDLALLFLLLFLVSSYSLSGLQCFPPYYRYFFLFIFTRSDLLDQIGWSIRISKSLKVSFSKMDSRLCIYHLVLWSYFNPLHNSQWTTFPT